MMDKLSRQTADKLKERIDEHVYKRGWIGDKTREVLFNEINSLASEDEQYTCKKCGAGWSDDTDIEIAKRKWKEFEADEDNPQYFPDWLDKA